MTAKVGDLVKVEYEGRLENGEVFDSSQHGDHSHPIQFTIGNHEVIPGFEENVIGMDIDEQREFSIAPENAYGPHREELIREFPRSQLPMDKEPQEGMVLGLMSPDGRQFPAKITKVTPETVTLDLNHPLAGKRLIFSIKLADIKTPEEQKAEKEEIESLEKKALEEVITEKKDEMPASDEKLADEMEEIIEEAEEKKE